MTEKYLIKAGENLILTPTEKEQMIIDAEQQYEKFLDALQFDWKNDPNMKETPHRVAKMYVNELFKGCYNAPPKITTFENNLYDGMVYEGNIDVKSVCSHHHLSFTGKAHIAYLPGNSNKIIGLSKLNRIVDYFSRRPQVQENLTTMIHDYLNEILPDNTGIAVMLECKHMCVYVRGIEQDSIMKTSKLSGKFLNDSIVREEFYNFIK
ncbi:MAG: GTP cyclohydrolase I [Candidatus Omnitrophica bacterium]|jgi:GTP cyclohydrolase I|nr:GTP cyclohydrolase I [Candidatus Omnitrophota bacterium]